jgi:hypothetical protein
MIRAKLGLDSRRSRDEVFAPRSCLPRSCRAPGDRMGLFQDHRGRQLSSGCRGGGRGLSRAKSVVTSPVLLLAEVEVVPRDQVAVSAVVLPKRRCAGCSG